VCIVKLLLLHMQQADLIVGVAESTISGDGRLITTSSHGSSVDERGRMQQINGFKRLGCSLKHLEELIQCVYSFVFQTFVSLITKKKKSFFFTYFASFRRRSYWNVENWRA